MRVRRIRVSHGSKPEPKRALTHPNVHLERHEVVLRAVVVARRRHPVKGAGELRDRICANLVRVRVRVRVGVRARARARAGAIGLGSWLGLV